MLRPIQMFFLIIIPTIALGIPLGMMLGSYATGRVGVVRLAGYTAPDQGVNVRSADNSDQMRPAAASYTTGDYGRSSGFAY